jgi:hypothetical protein
LGQPLTALRARRVVSGGGQGGAAGGGSGFRPVGDPLDVGFRVLAAASSVRNAVKGADRRPAPEPVEQEGAGRAGGGGGGGGDAAGFARRGRGRGWPLVAASWTGPSSSSAAEAESAVLAANALFFCALEVRCTVRAKKFRTHSATDD